jgi:HSP20 family protein
MRWPSTWDDEDILPTTSSNNLDVYETGNEVVVKANIPGVSKDKVEITFEKGVLWVRGEEEKEEKEEKKYYHKAVRSFSYKVAVPGNIDMKAEPEAVIDNGVVMVTFKKAEEEKPKKIEIKTK